MAACARCIGTPLYQLDQTDACETCPRFSKSAIQKRPSGHETIGYHENLLNIRSISDRIKHCLDLTTGVARYARMLPVCFSSPR